MNILIKVSIIKILLLLAVGNVLSQSQWDIQFIQSSLDCSTNEACYRLQVKSAGGANWVLADQNYRLFFDGDLMTVNSVTSLLPPTFYGGADIGQNIKISGQGQENASPLDDIDDNLGFLDFSIVLSNKSNPPAAQELDSLGFIDIAEICVTLDFANSGNNCVSFYHSRPSTAGSITSQYTTLTENNAPGSTVSTEGANYDDLNQMDGAIACPGLICSTSKWNIQFTQASVDCDAAQVCYQLEMQNTSGPDWAIGDQNYRLFYDGDLMTVASVSSLLPSNVYNNAVINQDIKITGQEASSPLDDIDDNLGFLDFNIVQTNKADPAAAAQLTSGAYTDIATICVDVTPDVINDPGLENCLSFYHSRPSTAGTITNQYIVVTENDLPESTTATEGVGYNDLTPVSDDSAACPAFTCSTKEWDIQIVLNDLNCETSQVCYQLEIQNAGGGDWALGDQNYRLFYDADLMSITSVSSLLSSAYYSPVVVDQDIQITGQEANSPLNDIDDNLGFLDFNIIQFDKSSPLLTTRLMSAIYTPIALICMDIEPEVTNEIGDENCLSFYHSRPSTAGSITNQYTVITENDAPNSTTEANGLNYDDLNSDDDEEACLAVACSNPICDLEAMASAPIYNDNNTPPNLTDDTFTISVTVAGSNLLGWEGGGQSGAYGDTIIYGPYPVAQSGVVFSITDVVLGMKCQTSIGANAQTCAYTGDCDCCTP